MSADGQDRVLWLDSCKGFAMILVVIGHIMSGYRSAGLFINEQHIIVAVYDFIYSFHMALFFCISGSVFYIAYVSHMRERKHRFIIQVINLVIVYFSSSILLWGFKVALSSQVNEKLTVRDLLLLPIRPISPYWYLWDLVFFYILFYKLCGGRLKDSTLTIISVMISLVGSFIHSSCPFYLLSFWLGIYLAKTKYRRLINPGLMIGCMAILCITAYQAWAGKAGIRDMPVLSLVSALGITYVCLSLFAVILNGHRLKCLDTIGRYSLEIYVTHCYITAANRKILIKLGISNFYINVLVNTVAAIVIPIVCAWILKKMKFHEQIFRPASWWIERRGNK